MYSCINLHFTDFCNYHCKHCFVKKENYELDDSLSQISQILNSDKNDLKKNNINQKVNYIIHNIKIII